ncbi:hypothetical protein ACH5RR_032703 [Cinchona calisaya]|uniref:Uncharacterized protein n=1 Tax=Cinchona calisaya TaxID=153742 RepID=A0ABD2YIX1_9GENT
MGKEESQCGAARLEGEGLGGDDGGERWRGSGRAVVLGGREEAEEEEIKEGERGTGCEGRGYGAAKKRRRRSGCRAIVLEGGGVVKGNGCGGWPPYEVEEAQLPRERNSNPSVDEEG